MSNLKILVTPNGKHPASKWAEFAADELVEISEQAPETRVQEARKFRGSLVSILTHHHQVMMDHEQEQIKAGKHAPHLPYETEDYASTVCDAICEIAKDTNFGAHFAQAHVREWVEGICNKYFKSAKLVERQHFHSEQQISEKPIVVNSKRS
jgi:hypothetical protein